MNRNAQTIAFITQFEPYFTKTRSIPHTAYTPYCCLNILLKTLSLTK